MQKAYIEHQGKVVETGDKFKHVMAIALDPKADFKTGVVRCILSRSGDLAFKGNVDRSELHKVTGETLEHFVVGEKLNIKNEEEILNNLLEEGDDFIGLEDPDIFIEQDLTHLYFTIPIIPKDKNKKIKVHLGHAVGRDLDSLVMTKPVLVSNDKFRAKEVSIPPVNSKGFRYVLFESRHTTTWVAIARDMGGTWEYGQAAFDSKKYNMQWMKGGTSPGPFFPKSFIDVGEGKLLGVINGMTAEQKIGDKVKHGDFSVGLFIYDYENGKIDWISPEIFIQDSEAGVDGERAITFASQFVETGPGEGILYAHVDDSFIRAYTLKAEEIKKILPNINFS